MSNSTKEQIVFPDRLVNTADLSRLIRELTALDDSIHQSSLRKPGAPTVIARSSQTLEELARTNHIKLTDAEQRAQLLNLLEAFYQHAPRIHMGLATEPSAGFTRSIITWLRKNVHPLVLLEVGLQPTIAAGCTIRTDNKFFDMSLRNHFAENRTLLVEKIAEIGQKSEDKALATAIEAQKDSAA